MMDTVNEVKVELGVAPTCDALGLPRSTYYRRSKPKPSPLPAKRRPSRALSADQEQQVLDVLHEPRFVDLPPAEVWAALIDEDTYHCSIRTMYRILAKHKEVRERRDQLRHPHYASDPTGGDRTGTSDPTGGDRTGTSDPTGSDPTSDPTGGDRTGTSDPTGGDRTGTR